MVARPRPLSAAYAAIYAVVRRIPRGRVATYGQVAALSGRPRHARQVGYALHALHPGSDVPWHRVINARGEISLRAVNGAAQRQRALLRREGVRVSREGRIALERFQWAPRVGATPPRRRLTRRSDPGGSSPC